MVVLPFDAASIHRNTCFFIPCSKPGDTDLDHMTIEYRRSPRKIDYLPLEVAVVRTNSGKHIAGPFSGRIIDISRHGACLLMSQMIRNGFHLYYSTRETADALVQLTINMLPESGSFTLKALPVWMATFNQQEIRAFKMGVDFTENPEEHSMKELQRAILENQERRAQWWKNHVRDSDYGS